jgi:hypothetical protein
MLGRGGLAGVLTRRESHGDRMSSNAAWMVVRSTMIAAAPSQIEQPCLPRCKAVRIPGSALLTLRIWSPALGAFPRPEKCLRRRAPRFALAESPTRRRPGCGTGPSEEGVLGKHATCRKGKRKCCRWMLLKEVDAKSLCDITPQNNAALSQQILGA